MLGWITYLRPSLLPWHISPNVLILQTISTSMAGDKTTYRTQTFLDTDIPDDSGNGFLIDWLNHGWMNKCLGTVDYNKANQFL